MKIILRGDDLGYSRGINYGILDAVKSGFLKSVGVMVNMPETEHGVSLVANEDLAFGLHVNISAGSPLATGSEVSGLLDEKGHFRSSRYYRDQIDDPVNFDEVLIEIDAQYQAFKRLFMREPDYIDGHAIKSPTFFAAISAFASQKGIKYSGLPDSDVEQVTELMRIGNSDVRLVMESMEANYEPQKLICSLIERDEEIIYIVVFHPGYLDAEIMASSSLLEPRTKETAFLLSKEAGRLFPTVELLSYREL